MIVDQPVGLTMKKTKIIYRWYNGDILIQC